ncbi:MAG: mechanosensitive ion channel [Clostridia bacterium]|nr:mechanosensitive ion channel [Clostridia bacterium]
MNWQAILDSIVSWATNTGIKIIISLIVMLIAFRVITIVSRKLEKKLLVSKQHLDKTLVSTLLYIGRVVLKIIVVICLIGYLGIDTSSLTALVASLGVCFGLAVNGAVSNIAGGILILITRPFRIDDFIETSGYSGVVEDIHITHTRIRTGDNKVVYIPNGSLSASSVVNYSIKDIRRVDLTFSIGYNNDFDKAKQIITDICNAHELTLKDHEPFVRVSEHGASSINIVTRVWVKSDDFWTVHFDLLESVKKAFDENGIEIPYNQLDVHVKND